MLFPLPGKLSSTRTTAGSVSPNKSSPVTYLGNRRTESPNSLLIAANGSRIRFQTALCEHKTKTFKAYAGEKDNHHYN